jgi:predicted DNA-binding protein (MmcQ/YjbR family)
LNYDWLSDYCTAKPGAEKDYKEEWAAYRYMIRGKMFAMQGGDKEGKPIITVKLEPARGAVLRAEYADIVPGYYMNKQHWNSVYLEGVVPEDLLKELLDESYDILLNSLSKKAQAEIRGKNSEPTK